MRTFSIADLVPSAPWMLIDHRWDDSWAGCQHCGAPIKRVYLIEEEATGRRLQVGKTCLSKFGIAKPIR
jgi:hypothetical protein